MIPIDINNSFIYKSKDKIKEYHHIRFLMLWLMNRMRLSTIQSWPL